MSRLNQAPLLYLLKAVLLALLCCTWKLLTLFSAFQAALEALQHLWSSGRLSRLSSRICDSVILILCHLIRGEQIARDKLKEEKEEEAKKAKSAPTSSQGDQCLFRFTSMCSC